MKPVKIYKMKDKNESLYIDKGDMFNLPMKLLVVGKSQISGKSNFLCNLLLQDDSRLYKNNFKGEDIYIFSGSIQNDEKIKCLIEYFDIPESNLFSEFDEDILDTIYEMRKEEFILKQENKEKPNHFLIILDDMSFGGNLKSKSNGAISKAFCNGRHILCSVILTSQKLTDILSVCRENATGGIFFSCSEKQLDILEADNNYLEVGDKNPKKLFRQMFRESTKEKHSFFVVNYSNPYESLYMNKNFLPINTEQYK